jgi:protein CpxP
MTNPDTSPNAPATSAPGPQATPRRGRRYFTIAAIVIAAGLTGAVATQAFEHGFGRGGWHGHGMMGGFGGRFGGPIDPERAARRADRMVRHLAIEIDATTEQQEKLRGIVKSAVSDLLPMREKARAARERARTLLTQPSIDRAAIEAFRAEQIALADQASKRLSQALAEAAEVLTPEQRQQISEHMERRRGHWRGWRRGERQGPDRP